MDLKMNLYVKRYKQFTRKNGTTGQEIVVRTPNGYSCTLNAPNKEDLDLSSIPINQEVSLLLEPDFILVKGERFYQNILSLMVVAVVDDDIVIE